MKLAIMQPYLFPYIGYFQLINAVDKFVSYDDVTFIKGGWINRNRILVNNSEYVFTVPINSSSNMLIRNIKLSENDRWKNKLLKTLGLAYKKAPYFEETFLLVSEIISLKTKFIKDLHIKSFQLINEYLGIETPMTETSTTYNNQNLKGQHRVLDICLKENADYYINPIGGQELYDKEIFIQNGIKLDFLKSEEICYSQFKNEFVPWLSIIDVMMFNSSSGIKQMLNEYELI